MASLSKKALQQALGVSREGLRKLILAGMPDNDIEAARKWRTTYVKPNDGGASYHDYRLTNARIDAAAKQIDLKRKLGELVDRAEAERVVFGRARMERDAWLAFAADIAPVLAAQFDIDAPALEAALEAHVRRHLQSPCGHAVHGPQMSALAIDEAWRRGLAPAVRMSIAEWADRYRILPTFSAHPGKWRTDRAPYLREPMETLSPGSPFERTVIMSAAQAGKTEVLLNAVGAMIMNNPGMAMLVMPTTETVARNTRTRIDPLIEATPGLAALVATPRAKGAGNTLSRKVFPGGELILTGGNSAAALRSTPVQYLFCDEVDAWPDNLNGEGDPLSLAIARTTTFRAKRRIAICSTPTLKGASRIEALYLEGDQRRFFAPCPQCRTAQTFDWDRVEWPEGRPEAAYMVCAHCGGVIEEKHKRAMLAAGEWRPTAAGDGRTASFHIPGAAAAFATWGEIARDYLAAKVSSERLQAWTNTALGEPYEDEHTRPVEADALAGRAEESEHPWPDLLPEGVAVITAGVDTQVDRLEVEFVGWGRNEESWSLDYRIIWGDPALPSTWAELDRLLLRRFRHPREVAVLPVAAVAVDTGGLRTKEAVQYAAERAARRVWGIKGSSVPSSPPWPKRPPKVRAGKLAPLFIVGVSALKHTHIARLSAEAGPGCCHFPAERDLDWYRGITSERPIRKWHRGTASIQWVKDPAIRNEPLDCRIYAMAALHGLLTMGLKLPAECDRIAAAPLRRDPLATEPETSRPPRPRVSRSRWMAA